MKGLLLKDFYFIREHALLGLIASVLVGVGLFFVTKSIGVTTISCFIFTQFALITISKDKDDGWLKKIYLSSQKTYVIVLEKYILYVLCVFIATFFGLIFDIVFIDLVGFGGITANIFLGSAITLIAGVAIIPFQFLLKRETVAIVNIAVYIVTSAFVVFYITIMNSLGIDNFKAICYITLFIIIINTLLIKFISKNIKLAIK